MLYTNVTQTQNIYWNVGNVNCQCTNILIHRIWSVT